MSEQQKPFQFEISLSVLNHLGRNLYRNFITVLGEAVSNSWDADAKNVWITIDRAKSTFSIKDDGDGMSAQDFQDKFLKIGYSKRRGQKTHTARNRPYIGAKGIGKLALLSCANTVSIYSKKQGSDYVGGVIDNRELDKAITHDNTADQYPLSVPDLKKIERLKKGHDHGTIIIFDGLKESLKSSTPQLRKLLALSFKFALIDKEFTLHVDGTPITENDLKDLAEATEFMWSIEGYEDAFTKSFKNLKKTVALEPAIVKARGFLATVDKPSKLKITGTDERATVDLFVNGRLREKNVIRHIPTQRIVESYLYGQIHFDALDRPGADPFTSSREGIIEDDGQFAMLKKELKDLLQKVIDQWDELRLERGEEGDDENSRKTKKERKALDMYNIARLDYEAAGGTKEAKDKVDTWLEQLRNDAAFNLQAYVDCFLSENLVRKYIEEKGLALSNGVSNSAADWKKREDKTKGEANISFEIRAAPNVLSYLDMDALAVTAEGTKTTNGMQSLWSDAVQYKPTRNAVGHTGLLSGVAKTHLNITAENIKARLRTLLAKP
ncbi:ATP-binding protein [Rhizobium laguerreae]|uniref:ATP-binding protein n=1 Tax=Rhizobium laguerreae TaxID=1076926 RepID=UPI001C926771|nr:ATP-binding protein [Rhizobium laguerreae]MBY3558580.1 DNA mismatch repair protein [Rhizobium laguerreae]